MNLGDQNNAFFHNQMKVRHARNAITYLVDDTGRRVEDLSNISQLVVDFCGCITSFFFTLLLLLLLVVVGFSTIFYFDL